MIASVVASSTAEASLVEHVASQANTSNADEGSSRRTLEEEEDLEVDPTATNWMGLFQDPELEAAYVLGLSEERLWWVVFLCAIFVMIMIRASNFFWTVNDAGQHDVLILVSLLWSVPFIIIAVVLYVTCIRSPLTKTTAVLSERIVCVVLGFGLICVPFDTLIEDVCENETQKLPAREYYSDCYYRIFVWSTFQACLPLMLLKIRGIVTIINILVNFCCVVMSALHLRERNRTDMGGTMVVRFGVYSFICSVSVLAAVMFDLFRRQSFLTFCAMVEQQRAAAALEKQVQKTLTSLVPQETISRVLNKEPVIDSNTKCCVGVFQIYDYATWSTTRLPHECVEVVDSLFSDFDKIVTGGKNIPLEKVLMTGDIFVFSLGLRRPRNSDDPAVGPQGEIPVVADPSAMLTFSLKCIRRVKALRTFGVKITAGIGTGPCVAALFGTRNLRYNLLGAAFDTAMSLSQHATEPMTLTVCDPTHQLLPQPPRFTLRIRAVDIGGTQTTAWVVSFRAKKKAAPVNILAAPPTNVVDRPDSPISSSAEGRSEMGPVHSRPPPISCSPVSLDFDLMMGAASDEDEEHDTEEQLFRRERNLNLRDQFLSTMVGCESGAIVAGKRHDEYVADKAGLEPKYTGWCSRKIFLDFSSAELEYAYWDYCNATARLAVLCDITFSFVFQTVGNLWLTSHMNTATPLSVAICVLITLLALFRGLMWKLELLPPDRAALYFVPTMVLQTGCNVALFYTTLEPSFTSLCAFLVIFMEYLVCVAGHNIPLKWGILCDFLMWIPASYIPMYIMGAEVVTWLGLFISGFFFVSMGMLPLIGMEADRRRDYGNQVLTLRLEATAESHMDAHEGILQMVLPSFVVADAMKKLSRAGQHNCVVKEVSDMVLLSLRLEVGGGRQPTRYHLSSAVPDVQPALKLYAAVERVLQGIRTLVLVQAVGNQLLIAGPMVQRAVEENALLESRIEMAGPRRDLDKTSSHATMRTMLSIVSELRAEYGHHLSAVLASGSGFASVIGGVNPTFDVTGVAKRLSVALMDEAAPGYCGATKKAMQLLETYLKGSEAQIERDLASVNLQVEPSVSWRIRGIGFVEMVSWRQRNKD